MKTALLIGGSGPTGPHLLNGLRQRGYRVAVLNRGVHPMDYPDDVEHIIADPHFIAPLQAAIGNRSFDLVLATYGRLSLVAEALANRTPRFVGIGGVAAYRGFFQTEANKPYGQPVPTREDAPLVTDVNEHRFSALIVAAERAVMKFHPTATMFRYPYVYGPRQIVPREWSLVRRVLDGRRTIILVNGGRVLMTHGFAENLTHGVMLAVDKPKESAGKIYNCGDEIQYDQRQLVEIAADALGVKLDIVSVPDIPAIREVCFSSMADHKLLDLHLIRNDLDYRDLTPSIEAIARTIRWYRDNPLQRGGEYEQRMTDKFDYATEDRIIALYGAFAEQLMQVKNTVSTFVHPYPHPTVSSIGRDHRGR